MPAEPALAWKECPIWVPPFWHEAQEKVWSGVEILNPSEGEGQ